MVAFASGQMDPDQGRRRQSEGYLRTPARQPHAGPGTRIQPLESEKKRAQLNTAPVLFLPADFQFLPNHSRTRLSRWISSGSSTNPRMERISEDGCRTIRRASKLA